MAIPKVKLDCEYAEDYYRINDLDQRDMELIVEELREIGVIGVIDERFIN